MVCLSVCWVFFSSFICSFCRWWCCTSQRLEEHILGVEIGGQHATLKQTLYIKTFCLTHSGCTDHGAPSPITGTTGICALKGGYPLHCALTGGYPLHCALKGGYPLHCALKGGYPLHCAFKGGYSLRRALKGGYPLHRALKGGYPLHCALKGGYPLLWACCM